MKSKCKELEEKIKVLRNYCIILKKKDELNKETKRRNQELIVKLNI